MNRELTRRTLLSSAAVLPLAGCLGRFNDDTPELAEDSPTATTPVDNETGLQIDPDPHYPEPDCEMETGEWRGEASPIAVERGELPDYMDSDDVDMQCAQVAANAALEALNTHTRLNLETKNWAGVLVSRTPEIKTGVSIMGGLSGCPSDEGFDVVSARSFVPESVTVTLDLVDWDEAHTCTHEMYLEASIGSFL